MGSIMSTFSKYNESCKTVDESEPRVSSLHLDFSLDLMRVCMDPNSSVRLQVKLKDTFS